jgi:uncharacterized protein (TIGR00369 family)
MTQPHAHAGAAPPQRRNAAEQAKLDAHLVEMFEKSITFNQVLGLRVDSVACGDVRGHFDMRPELVGHFTYGRLHGGAITSVLDAFGGLVLMVEIAERHPTDSALQALQRFARLGTIDLRTDFLRPGLGKRFMASAEVTRLGGRVGSTQMKLANEAGEIIATGAASYIVS